MGASRPRFLQIEKTREDTARSEMKQELSPKGPLLPKEAWQFLTALMSKVCAILPYCLFHNVLITE